MKLQEALFGPIFGVIPELRFAIYVKICINNFWMNHDEHRACIIDRSTITPYSFLYNQTGQWFEQHLKTRHTLKFCEGRKPWYLDLFELTGVKHIPLLCLKPQTVFGISVHF